MNEQYKQTEFNLPETREERDKLLGSIFLLGDIVEELNKRAGSYYLYGPGMVGNLSLCRERAMADLAAYIGDAKIIMVEPNNLQQAMIDDQCKFYYVDMGFRYAPGFEPAKPVDNPDEKE